MRRRAARLAAALLDLAAVALLVPLLGGAVEGSAARTVSVGAAAWGAAAAVTGQGPPGGALVLPWASGGPDAVALVDVVVTGDLAVVALTLRLDAADPDDGPAVDVAACVGGTWSGGSCTGEVVPLGDLTVPTDLAVALDPGGRVALRATARRNVANRTTFALTVAVPRTAVRVGVQRVG